MTAVIARKFFRDKFIAVLAAASTIAGARIYSPGDWPTNKENMPAILVSTPHDIKRSLVRANPSFNTTVTIAVDLRIERDDSTDTGKGGGAIAAQNDLDIGSYQIEQAILTDVDLIKYIQQFNFVETKSGIDSNQGKHVGQAIIAFGVELYEGWEDFTVPIEDMIEEVRIKADLINPVDKVGTYATPTEPAYTPPAAPRTHGPDGRVEGTAGATNLDE